MKNYLIIMKQQPYESVPIAVAEHKNEAEKYVQTLVDKLKKSDVLFAERLYEIIEIERIEEE